MGMKVGIFYSSFNRPEKFPNKVALMDNFAQGVRLHGDRPIEFRDQNLSNLDIDAGFILGYTLDNNFRKHIINSLESRKIPRIFVDSNILHYARSEHEWHRYSMNSVYPDTGVYFFSNIDSTKWTQYSSWHGVAVKPWRRGNDQQHVLILCQRPHGWNMFGNDQWAWLNLTIQNIRNYTDRPIRVRMHPGDGKRQQSIDMLTKQYSPDAGISFSGDSNIKEDLENCWCAVGYNSTPNVVAAIEGVPVYVEDPQHSWAADIAFSDMRQIIDPPMPDRGSWLDKIANIHWSNQEVRDGVLWAAIRNYISGTR